MAEKTIHIDYLSPDMQLRQPIRVIIQAKKDGLTYASAPDLGLWVDGVGESESEALGSLRRTICNHINSFREIDQNLCSDSLRSMKFALQRLVI